MVGKILTTNIQHISCGAMENEQEKSDSSSTATVAASHSREQFGDCALIEMIHLHDCFRGAIRSLQEDVGALRRATVDDKDSYENCDQRQQQQLLKLIEKKITGRFQVIWSVFQAHSAAEDEFIWPALLSKLDKDETDAKVIQCCSSSNHNSWREYEKDHAVLERMFSGMDQYLAQLRDHLGKTNTAAEANNDSHSSTENKKTKQLIKIIQEHAEVLSKHLLDHLKQEETNCMPLIAKRLTKAEIQDLVGCIMGKRSADTVTKIMIMATQSLDNEERLDMLRYMKEAMEGTFFDRWLLMSGWIPEAEKNVGTNVASKKRDSVELEKNEEGVKRFKVKTIRTGYKNESTKRVSAEGNGPKELKRFVRAIATNPGLTAAQKSMTIRRLEDSVRLSCLRNEQQSA